MVADTLVSGVITGAALVPLPPMRKVYGFSSASSLAMLTSAVRLPVADGVSRRVKVVVPLAAATGVVASLWRVKSVDPLRATRGVPLRVRAPSPVLRMVKVCSWELPTATPPKSVSSVTVGTVWPAGISMPPLPPSTAISGPTVPVPWMATSYGFSFRSSAAIERVAVRRPAAEGLKVTVKVVVPPPAATGELGDRSRLKSVLCVPPMTTKGAAPVRVSAAVPSLRMVNVCETAPAATSVLPKSVPSVVDGVLSPSAIETAGVPPRRSISGSSVVKVTSSP